MTPDAMAALHAQCFANAPWSATALRDLLGRPTTCAFFAPNQDGFLLAQVIVPEAEILTVAVDPGARRQGVARSLLHDLLILLDAKGCTDVFLEVAQDNAGAIALYEACGFKVTGRRKAYYRRNTGPAADAVLMRRKVTGRQRD